ncbi:MAG: YgaP family membrane protein [Acidimicrobiales bacterium]
MSDDSLAGGDDSEAGNLGANAGDTFTGGTANAAPVGEEAGGGGSGMPKPQGWPLERVLGAIAGGVVLSTLALGRAHSPRWRVMTAFVGANLVLNAAVGWCPASLVLHKLGVKSMAEGASCSKA